MALRSSLVVAVACLAVGISTGAVAGEPGTAVTFGSATSAALVPAPLASFSERTGYSSVPLTEISGSVPAAGAESLVVTFEPSSSLLYDPPAPGAAPMSVDQVAAAYGLSGPAYASAEAYFESEGLAVAHSWPDRLSLSLTGSVAAVDRAFSTSIRSGVFDGGRVTFTGTPPSLPTGLESEVASVAGLESGFDRFSLPEVAQPLASVGSSRPTQNPTDLVTPS
ncbi:MAG: protease pro-enzyme activation domain-containing protein, partial [Thermoplasmata archaeon]